MSALWGAYRVIAPCAGALAPALRWTAPSPERRLWDERLGAVSAPPRPDAWIHAASLGEAVATRALAEALRARHPGARFHLTATTRTGRERLRELEPEASLAPLDTPQTAARFFRALEPRRLFLLETELWPQWLARAREGGVPVAVISARLSPDSVRRYRWLGPTFAREVGGLAAVLCQSAEDRERWLALGARPDRTVVTGNLKLDALPAPVADRGAARRALGLMSERPLLVLGSLRPREADLMARAWAALPGELTRLWQVVAVPRHARASAQLRAEAAAAGIAAIESGAPESGSWRWDDRPGVLRDYYAAADAAVVGGSFFPYGGHNPLEPAATGAAVMIGPHHSSQGAGVEILRAAGAITIVAPSELAAALGKWLEDHGSRIRQAAAGLDAVRAARGASTRAVEQLERWNLWPPA